MHRAACGCASALRGGAEVLGQGASLRRREQVFDGKCVVRSAGVHWRCEGNASALRGAYVGAAWGSGSARVVRVAVLGRATAFGGECVVRSAGLTHFRRSGSRVRVLLYIRPPRHRREIAAMGTKDAPCEHPSSTKTSAPAPSAFIFPPRRSHFPRIPFGGAHEDFGIPPNDVRPCRAVVCTSASSFTLSRIPFGGAHEDFGPPQ